MAINFILIATRRIIKHRHRTLNNIERSPCDVAKRNGEPKAKAMIAAITQKTSRPLRFLTFKRWLLQPPGKSVSFDWRLEGVLGILISTWRKCSQTAATARE